MTVDPHEWQEYNKHGNTCHYPDCPLTEEEHPRKLPGFVGMLKSGNPNLSAEAKEIVRAPIEREDGSFIPAQRLCWNSGKGGHLCNKKCENEPPYGTTLDDLVAEAREKQFRQYAEWSDKQIRSLWEGQWR